MIDDSIRNFKRRQLELLAEDRDHLRLHPKLKWLFFEITSACNLHCAHCGSSCEAKGERLSAGDIKKVLQSVPSKKPMICLTGGEPLLHPDFFGIAEAVMENGFSWGMTSNGTLVSRETARKLRDYSMSTISISLDGLETKHDIFRQKNGAWQQAVDGIRNLQEAGFAPQVTTVVHAENMDQLDDLYHFLAGLGIESWRIINIEPIGRACESKRLLLTKEQFGRLLQFIRTKRYDQSNPMEVTYGCSHYLGTDMERMVRDNYFLCGAGIYVASVRSNGDICACLDIENSPSLAQGNINKDDFWQVWCQKYLVFRSDRTKNSPTCCDCEDRRICGGDSAHTWDWKANEPLMCWKKGLFEEHDGTTKSAESSDSCAGLI